MASMHEPEDALARLERLRKESDRLYNEALTALDGALPERPVLPEPPAGFDDFQIHPLNTSWRIVSEADIDWGTGWRGRLRRFVWNLIGPFLERQERFNAALVEHVNRNHQGETSGRTSVSGVITALDTHLQALAAFHSRLIQYLQQITLYVDTKDRREIGRLEQSLTAGLDSVTDEFRMRLESAAVHGHRIAAGMESTRQRLDHLGHMAADMESLAESTRQTRNEIEALQSEVEKRSAEQQGLRQSVDLVTAGTHSMKRELERLCRAPSPAAEPAISGPPRPVEPDLDAYKYVCFEDSFRGSREEIMAHQRAYLSYFEGASDVVDLGCGRGEFLSVLREGGITARGVDGNAEAVERCREQGLDATRADALGHLRTLADESIGGLFSSQVVEHLEATYLQRLLAEAHRSLRPDSRIVVETLNPACWMAFFSAYVRDITHRHPVHPETLKYLLRAGGFVDIEIVYRSPLPEVAKLQQVAVDPTIGDTPAGATVLELATAFNQHAERLNGLLFAEQDYAAIGRRP
ncbi:MAG: class I SAM-dependent methyltransferase [Acidobacteria bacterium]|nr:class I SAM-dependent methyltransferase [Acidobacteriota bacterium]